MTAKDILAVTALIHEYAERIDAGDLDGVAAMFADATWRSPGRAQPLRGAAEVRRAYDGVILYDGVPSTKHAVTNVVVEVTGDTATARSYFTVLQALADFPLQPIVAGRYHDRFVRDENGWRFVERIVWMDLTGDLSRHLVGYLARSK